MNLLASLLDTLVRFDGEALVMHAGEKPYVVTPSTTMRRLQGALAPRRVELGSRALTPAAVSAMLNRLLSPEARDELAASGCGECDVAERGQPTARFMAVAFRRGDDLRLEVRRRDRHVPAASLPGDRTNVLQFEAVDGPGLVEADIGDADEGDDVMTEGELSEMLRASMPAAGVGVRSAGQAAAVVAAWPHSEHVPPAGWAGAALDVPRGSALVVPIARPVHHEPSRGSAGGVSAVWPRAVQIAADRGAVALYLVAQAPATARVDGELVPLEGVPVPDVREIERLTLELRAAGGATGGDVRDEWVTRVPEAGPIRCVAFRDHRGPGLLVRMPTARIPPADWLGLTPDIQALASEADGLVLVAGGRRSGKTTLLASLVELVNRTRRDLVITVESRLSFVHDARRSVISQREIRGDDAAFACAIRGALREEPDVLVIDEIGTSDAAALAIDAAESGALVLAAIAATSTTAAVQRLLELLPADCREQARPRLARALRAAVALVLLRGRSGGRVPAREVLLNTEEVTGLVREGRMRDLPAAIEAGRRHGMVSFAEALATLVIGGTVHPSHACRKAPSRAPFLAALRRDGIQTDALDQLA